MEQVRTGQERQVTTGQDNTRLDRSGPERKGEDKSVTITIIKKT